MTEKPKAKIKKGIADIRNVIGMLTSLLKGENIIFRTKKSFIIH